MTHTFRRDDNHVPYDQNPNAEVAMGNISGSTLWNKFGYNADVDVGTEVIASFGGTFVPLTTASTLSIVSTSGEDAAAQTGAFNVVITGVDANRKSQVEVITMTGVTPVVTTTTWLGINRMAVYLSGTALNNVGTITATAVTGSAIQAQMPATEGTTQQCIFFVQAGYQFLAEWLTVNTLKITGQGSQNPLITVKGWVYSAVSGSKYEVFRTSLDTSITNFEALTPPLPFPVTESSCFWLEATSDKVDATVNARFSGIERIID